MIRVIVRVVDPEARRYEERARAASGGKGPAGGLPCGGGGATFQRARGGNARELHDNRAHIGR